MTFKVINYDKNGKIIPDISKYAIPNDVKQSIVNMVSRGKKVSA